jgi:adenosine deaminase
MRQVIAGQLRGLPKVELHLHLDCCLSYAAASRLEPGLTRAQFDAEFVAPPRLDGLPAFLARTGRHLALLQTKEALALAVADLLAQLRADNVLYAEARFAPHQHRQGGLALSEVVDTVAQAIRDGSRDSPPACGLILCGLWSDPPEHTGEILDLVRAGRPGGVVVGMDVAGNEAHPNRPGHLDVLARARAEGIPFTVHAGEGSGPEAVREVVDLLGPARIGHGIRAIEDPALVQRLARDGTHLEICPSCNIQLGLYPSFDALPVGRLARAGVNVGINTDQRTITDTDLGREYTRLGRADGYWKAAMLRQANRRSMAAAFADEGTKGRLLAML